MYFKQPDQYVNMDFATLSLNYRGAKTYTSLELTQVYSNPVQNSLSTSTQQIGSLTQTMRNEQISRVGFQFYSVRLTNDWYINDKNTLGFILQVPIMHMDIRGAEQENHTIQTLGTDTLLWADTQFRQRMLIPQHSANLNYTHVFNDSLSRELTANIDYNRYTTRGNESETNYIYQSTPGYELPLMRDMRTNNKIDIYSAKVDFQTSFWHTGMLEAGAKWAMTQTDNTLLSDSVLIGSGATPTETVANIYREQVAAAYITAAKQFDEHWNAKVGLRGELTYSKGVYTQWGQTKTVERKPYFNLFPTAFVGYSPTQDMLNFAFKKQFLNRMLTLSLNVQDLLRSGNWKSETIGLPNSYAAFYTQGNQQSVRIGLTYLFGQQQWRKYRNVGNVEEASRLGQSGSTIGK